MTPEKMQFIIEAALMVAGEPLTIAAIQNLFLENERPDTQLVRTLLANIGEKHQQSGIELKEVASGFRLQAKAEYSEWLGRLRAERPPRYSRAFLETLAIIAYRQPITRAEIEDIRGVTVSSHIIKTLLEREWIRVIGYKDLPGKPAILGTTKNFLDHFNLKSLIELPKLTEFSQGDDIELPVQLSIAEETEIVDESEPAEANATTDTNSDMNEVPINPPIADEN